MSSWIARYRIKRLIKWIVSSYKYEAMIDETRSHESIMQRIIFNRFRPRKKFYAEEALLKEVKGGCTMYEFVVNMCIYEEIWPDYDFQMTSEDADVTDMTHRLVHQNDDLEEMVKTLLSRSGIPLE